LAAAVAKLRRPASRLSLRTSIRWRHGTCVIRHSRPKSLITKQMPSVGTWSATSSLWRSGH